MPTSFAYDYIWSIQCAYCSVEVSGTESMSPGCEPPALALPEGWFQLYADMLICPAHTLQIYVDDELRFVRPQAEAFDAVDARMGMTDADERERDDENHL